MKKCALIALIAMLIPTLSLSKTNNKTKHYANQQGSTLNLTYHDANKRSGKITGTFVTRVASKRCLGVIGVPHKVQGYYTGNAIALTVSYPRCGAAIAIVGNLDKDNNIETIWLDAHQASHSQQTDWNTRMIGYDKYRLVMK